MNPQEIFDTVVRHLAQQGGPARNDKGGCQYRGPHGRKCAAGILIPDDKYDPEIEGGYVTAERVQAVLGDLVAHMSLLESLQDAHDHAVFNGENGTATWRAPNEEYGIATKLHGIAGDFRLSPAAVSECFPVSP